MDRSKLRKFVNTHLKWVRWALQLQQWKVDIVIGETNISTTPASCDAKSMYRNAELTFDPERTHSEEDAFRNLRHEMLHVLLAEFDLLYEAVKRVAPSSDMEILDVLYHNAHERSIGNIERMLDKGLGLDGMKLIERAREVARQNGV